MDKDLDKKNQALIVLKSNLKKNRSFDTEFKTKFIETIEKNLHEIKVVNTKIKIDIDFYTIFIKQTNINNLDRKTEIEKDNLYYKNFLRLKKYEFVHKSSTGFFPKNLKLVSINPNPVSFALSDYSLIDNFSLAKSKIEYDLISSFNIKSSLYTYLRYFHYPAFSLKELGKIRLEDIVILSEKKSILLTYDNLLGDSNKKNKDELFYKIFIFDSIISKILNSLILKNDDSSLFNNIRSLEKEATSFVKSNISKRIYFITLARHNYYIFKSSTVEANMQNRNISSVYLTLSEVNKLFPNKLNDDLLLAENNRITSVRKIAKVDTDDDIPTLNLNSINILDIESLRLLLHSKEIENSKLLTAINETEKELKQSTNLHNKMILSYTLELLKKLNAKVIRLSTFQNYIYLINKHLFLMIENINDIKYSEFQNIIDRLERDAYKINSKKKIRNRIRDFFNFHKRENFNFSIENLMYPKSLVLKDEIDQILLEIDKVFELKTKTHIRIGKIVKYEFLQKKAFLLLGFYSGLRKNELRSRLLKDISLFDNKLVIDVNYEGLSRIKMKLKTRSAKRRVEVFIQNEKHYKIISDFITMRGKLNKGTKFVFLEIENSKIYSKVVNENLADELTEYIKNVTSRYCTFHSLRHSFATYTLEDLLKNKQNFPYAILQLSMMMGHETPEITISNYVHYDLLRLLPED